MVEKWPFLKSYHGLSAEFRILRNRKDIDYLKMRYENVIQKLTGDISQKLKALPSIFDDNGMIIYADSAEELPSYPVVLFNSKNYWVSVDNIPMCISENPKISFVSLVMTYEVFSIEIPSELTRTMKYFLS